MCRRVMCRGVMCRGVICRPPNKFCAVGLAETNTDPNLSLIYQLPGYKGYYQDIRNDKQPGTDVSLYVQCPLYMST